MLPTEANVVCMVLLQAQSCQKSILTVRNNMLYTLCISLLLQKYLAYPIAMEVEAPLFPTFLYASFS